MSDPLFAAWSDAELISLYAYVNVGRANIWEYFVHDTVDLSLADKLRDRMLAEHESRQKAPCEHEWVDARSQVVKSGEICLHCGALRA